MIYWILKAYTLSYTEDSAAGGELVGDGLVVTSGVGIRLHGSASTLFKPAKQVTIVDFKSSNGSFVRQDNFSNASIFSNDDSWIVCRLSRCACLLSREILSRALTTY